MNKMQIISNAQFSIYAFLDLLEYKFGLTLEELTLDLVNFKATSGLSIPINEIELIQNNDIYLNNIGLFGMAGPLPLQYTENLILHNYKLDFLDIFINRFVSLLYSAHKVYYLHYFSMPEKRAIFEGFVQVIEINDKLIYGSLQVSISFLKVLILKLLNEACDVDIEKCLPWQFCNNKHQICLNHAKLSEKIIGISTAINILLKIKIICNHRDTYMNLVDTNSESIKSLLSKYYQTFEVHLELDPSKYEEAVLNSAILGRGWYL